MDKPLKIAVYTICKNESMFVNRFMDTVKDADSVHVLDTGSTDNTVELLKARGADVKVMPFETWKTLEEYDAIVAGGRRPWRFDIPRNESLAMVPADVDICVCIDLDEILTSGWRKKVEEAWTAIPGVTRIKYMYAWSSDKKFDYNKIHSREGYEWLTPIHETLYKKKDFNELENRIDTLLVEHFPDGSKSRGQYLPLLELAVKEDPKCERSSVYLAREYMFYSRDKDSISEYKRYLSLNGGWKFERGDACINIAFCYGRLGDRAEQYRWLLHACAEAPTEREPWVELAAYCRMCENHSLGYAAAKQALAINHVPRSHLNRSDSWNEGPHDLASISAFYIGLKNESYDLSIKALERNPWDIRLISNCHLIQDLSYVPAPSPKKHYVDVIILAYTKTAKKYEMTCRCIRSLRQSSPNIEFNITVVETLNRDDFKWEYNCESMVYPPKPFNYNKYLQLGYQHSSKSNFLLILNNDVTVFSANCIETMIDAMDKNGLASASPFRALQVS